MNRRNFVQATGALAVASLVPSLASAFPMPVDDKWALPINGFKHDKAVGVFLSYHPNTFIMSDRISVRKEPQTKLCVTADYGDVFISDGKCLFKKMYPLLWYNLSGTTHRDQHYSIDENLFRLPRMQWPWEANYNTDLPLTPLFRGGFYNI